MTKKLDIAVTDGPLKVSGAETVHFRGQPLNVSGDLFLCRCGGTKNPPFCDGTHRTNGFNGTSPERPKKELKVWTGQTVRTVFNPNTCMHVFYCKPMAELRKREEGGDRAAAEEIMRVVETCPSGALTYERLGDGNEPARPRGRPDLDIQEGGEIRVQREFSIDRELNEAQPNHRATLCRCGLSNNKPFCDGRHASRKGFV